MTTTLAIGIGGAEQRLLAEPVPALFFGLAVIAHLPAWGGLALVADSLPWFAGGPGPVLAVLHLLTLGVLLATAMGASLQMLPVALARPAPAATACLAVFALLALGLLAMTTGLATIDTRLLAAGGGLLALAVAVYAATLVRSLARPPVNALKAHALGAVACLALAAGLAVALVADSALGILADHAGIAIAHALAAGFGFMGLMVLGLSPVLLPMFAIAEPPGGRRLAVASALWSAALAVAIAGVLVAATPALTAAALLGLAATGLHVQAMRQMLAKRMRRRLGPEFVFIRAAWGLLALALMALLLLALGQMPATGPAVVIVLVLYGWLLTILLGVLQRILPFLASMHAARRRARPLLPTKLVAERALAIHRGCHFAALAVLLPAVLLAVPWAIRAAAAIGVVGAVAFAWFAGSVAVRARRHIRTAAPAPQAIPPGQGPDR